MVGIVDYNAGNIRSVERALACLKVPYILSKVPTDLEKCDRLIFPGVGDACYSMKQLKQTGFDLFLKDWAASKKPLAGICLGSQIIFDSSDEGDIECLGLLHGSIKHFSKLWDESSSNSDNSLKVPHMGWNNLEFHNGSSKFLDGITCKDNFYFVHSYVICPEDFSAVKATADYGIKVPACVEKDNIVAFQFHPEKSGNAGLKILSNFLADEYVKVTR